MHPQDCLLAAQARRDSVQIPTKSDDALHMQAGAWCDAPVRDGTRQAQFPCQSWLWWHVACVVFEKSSDAGGFFVKQRFPEGCPSAHSASFGTSPTLRTFSHHQTGQYSSAKYVATLTPRAAEALPHGKVPEKEKISRKVVLTAQAHPCKALRLNPLSR